MAPGFASQNATVSPASRAVKGAIRALSLPRRLPRRRLPPQRRLASLAAGMDDDGVQSFTIDLPLQCGRVLRGATIAYETRGALSAAKDNVILHPTSFDATSSDLMYQVGPGKLLDTDRYHGA